MGQPFKFPQVNDYVWRKSDSPSDEFDYTGFAKLETTDSSPDWVIYRTRQEGTKSIQGWRTDLSWDDRASDPLDNDKWHENGTV